MRCRKWNSLWMAGLLYLPLPGHAEDPFAKSSDAGNSAVDTAPEEDAETDPFAVDGSDSGLPRISASRLNEKRDTMALRVEVWEVAIKDWVIALDRLTKPEEIANWRQDRLSEGTTLVHAPVLVVEAKSRNSTRSSIEKIYPTEYEPPQILESEAAEEALRQDPPKSIDDLISRFTSGALPTSFETRNLGVSLEAEIQPVTADEGNWDVAISFEDVVMAKMDTFTPEPLGVKMPQFHSFLAGGLVRVKEGQWQILASAPPPASTDASKTWVVLIRVDRAR